MRITQHSSVRPTTSTAAPSTTPAPAAQQPVLPGAPIPSAASSLPGLQGKGARAEGSVSLVGARLQTKQGAIQRADGFGAPHDVRPPRTNKAGGPRDDLVADPAAHSKDPSITKTRFTGPAFVDGASFKDIEQGQLADCYFCAAVAAVAYKNPALVENAVTDNRDGTFDITMYGYNQASQLQATKIRVDGDLYTGWQGGSPSYARSAGSKDPASMELWFPLVEKAYAQWHGSYDKIGNGGWPRDVMQALTGNPGQMFSSAQYTEEQLYTWAQNLETGRTIAVAFTHGTEQAALYTNTGVHASHAYTLLGAEEENGVKYMRLRNPWGRGEPGNDGVDDGIFRLPMSDFIRLFPHVDIGTA